MVVDIDNPVKLTEQLCEQHDLWVYAIGQIFVSFGEIEWFINVLLQEFENETKNNHSHDLVRKINRLEKLLIQKNLDPSLIKYVKKLLTRVKKYRELRNTIAHNQIQLTVNNNVIEYTICSFKNPAKLLTYGDISVACGELEDVALEWSGIKFALQKALSTRN